MAAQKKMEDALAEAQAAAFQQMQWSAELRRNDKGKVLPSLFNTMLMLEHDPSWRGVIAFDEFAYRIVKRKPTPTRVVKLGEWSDLDDVQVVLYCAEEHAFEPKKQTAMDAVLQCAYSHGFHPVREWLRGLEWDGQKRLAGLMANYFGAFSTVGTASLGVREKVELGVYLKALSVKWLVGAVARIMQPGCKLDTMVVLEGGQGIFKSTAIRALFGDDWFADSKLVIGDKDALAQMQGKWVYEMAEMDSHRKADDTAFKQFLSSQVDRVRWHYGRRAEDVPRQCLFVGTTNMDMYGKDETGMRRIWPVAVGRIDLAAIQADRDQLFAEAFSLFEQGARWWVDANKVLIDPEADPRLAELFERPVSERELFDRQAEDRMMIDAWQYPVQEWWSKNNALPYVTTAQVMTEALCLDKARWSKPEQMRVAAVLKRLGFSHRKVGTRNARFWAFVPPCDDAETVPGASEALRGGEDDLPL